MYMYVCMYIGRVKTEVKPRFPLGILRCVHNEGLFNNKIHCPTRINVSCLLGFNNASENKLLRLKHKGAGGRRSS